MDSKSNRPQERKGNQTALNLAYGILLIPFILLASCVQAQNYLTSTGSPPFSAPEPVEYGFTDASNGNLHLELPMGSYAQRGSQQPLPVKFVYDANRLWSTALVGTAVTWMPDPEGSWEGVTQLTGLVAKLPDTSSGCTWDYLYTDPNGTQHEFPPLAIFSGTNCSTAQSANAFAADSSGYRIYVSPSSFGFNENVYAPDGTLVATNGNTKLANGSTIRAEDANGNYIVTNSAGTYVDTVGRVLVSSGLGVSSYTLPNSQSPTASSQYNFTYSNITVSTAFGQSGIAECNPSSNPNCTMRVVQSMTLPNNTTFAFKYDCKASSGNPACGSPDGQAAYYGTLLSMTLPTGGQVVYSWQVIKDAYSNKHLFLSSRTSGGGTWHYNLLVLSTCTATQVGCQQQSSVTRPSGDIIAYTFTLNNGAWPTQEQHNDSNGAELTTFTTWDFSSACPWTNCHGAAYVRKLSQKVTVSVPGGNSITKQTTFAYDSAITGNVTATKEWNFYPGTSPSFPSVPDRATYATYYNAGLNIINKPTVTTLCNNVGSDPDCPGGGSKVTQVKVTYDSYGTSGLTAAPSGVQNHDDPNFGTGVTVRGNPTQISRWVFGSTFLQTTRTYDTTGQVASSTDPASHTTSFSYTDNYFSDNGANPAQSYSPSAPTNAYLTQVTFPTVGSVTMTQSSGYYFGSGKRALSIDPNTAKTFHHFMEPLDRVTQTSLPVGWTLNTYPSATEADVFTPVADASPSSSCVSCRANQFLYDSFGRKVKQAVTNAPGGPINVDTTYDGNGRVQTVSHAYVHTSDPTHVFETVSYDGLDRTLNVTHPDNQSAQTFYGGQVTNVGGLATQQGSGGASGYPILSFDEAGKQRQQWVDGFGRVIEVDEPAPPPNGTTIGTIIFNGSEQSTVLTVSCGPNGQTCQVTAWDGGVFTVTCGISKSVSWGGSGTTSASIATSIASAFNSDSSSPCAASASNNVVTFTSTSNQSISASTTWNTQYFGGPSFNATTSGPTLASNSGSLTYSSFVTTYTYDAADRLTQVTQGAQTRSFSYDGMGRATTVVTPEGGTDTLVYDFDSSCPSPNSFPGHLVKKLDARQIRTCFQYDAIGRLTNKNYSNGQGAVTYQYDQGGAAAFALGRLTKIADPSGSETYTYDSQGAGRITQIQKVVGTTTYTLAYQYNTGGQVTQITYPSGRLVNQPVDNIGRVSSVSDTKGSTTTTRSSAYTFYPSGNVQTFTYGNGVVANFTFSPARDQLTALSYAKGSTTLFSLSYFYQNDSTSCPNGAGADNGEVSCISDGVDSGRSIAYTYDVLGRATSGLTAGSTAYPKWGLSWGYDRYANRLNQTVTAGSAFSNTLSFANPGGAQTNRPDGMCFDASGNLLAETASPCPPTAPMYSYDAENEMTAFSGSSGAAAYVYDSHGDRVKKCLPNCTSPTTRTVYIFSGGKDVAEYDNGAAPTSPSREYIYSGGALLTTLAGASTTYHHSDHISVRVNTDASGNKIGEQGHYPYGEAWYSANTTTKFVFTSYERDSESGHDYAMARYYHVQFGRFCSVDPVMGSPSDPQSWNRYAYVRDNPVSHIDPSGLNWFTDIFKAIFSIFQIGNYGVTTPPTFPAPQSEQSVWDKLVDAITPPMASGTPPIFGFTSGGTDLGGYSLEGALGPCTKSLFGVTLASFTRTAPGKAGRFEGTKEGVWQGDDQADAAGQYTFDVVNVVSKTEADLKADEQIQNNFALSPDATVYGYTNAAAGPRYTVGRPPEFVDYTAKDARTGKEPSYLETQIFELGNSLGAITHKPLPGTPQPASSPENKEWGKQLLDCFTSNLP